MGPRYDYPGSGRVGVCETIAEQAEPFLRDTYDIHKSEQKEVVVGFFLTDDNSVRLSDRERGEIASANLATHLEYLVSATRASNTVGTIHTHSPTEGSLGVILSETDMITHAEMVNRLDGYTHTLVLVEVEGRLALTGLESSPDEFVEDTVIGEMRRIKEDSMASRGMPSVRTTYIENMLEQVDKFADWCFTEV